MMSKIYRFLKFALPIKALLILFVFIFFIILPIICWNLQYSSYFIEGDLNYIAYTKRIANNKRIAASRSYFNDYFRRKLLPFNYHHFTSDISPKKTYPQIGFVILATNRDDHKIDAYEPKYLGQTLHNLLLSIEKDVQIYGNRWENISISLCNVDKVPERFFELKILANYADVIELNTTKFKSINNLCNSKLHLLSCLDSAARKYKSTNKFIVIEDDFLANIDMINELTKVFNSLRKRFKTEIDSKLGYVQLYYPLNQVNFSFWDSNSWLEILMISSGLVFLLFIVYFRLHMRSLFIVYNIILFAVLFLICVGFVIAIGRPHWRSVYHNFTKTFHLVESFFQSAAAILLDREYIGELLNSEFSFKCREKETKLTFVNEIAMEKQRRILSVNRNLFKHIGLYSAFKNSINNPHHID